MHSFLRAFCVLCGSFLFVSDCLAAPTLESVFPPGGQRGAKTTIKLAGKWAKWPPRIIVDDPAITVEPLKAAGEATVSIAQGAEPGARYLRLFEAGAFSKAVVFIVGTLREVEEVETNDDTARAQQLASASVVVNGRLAKGGDVDQFAVKLDAGQTLVAALVAHETLGSPLDAILQVADGAGFVLQQNHDGGGLDPLLAFKAPRSGTYAVRVFGFPSDPNSSISYFGNPKCVYRLTLTTGPFVDHGLPLAVERGKPVKIELYGWGLPEDQRQVSLNTTEDLDRLFVAYNNMRVGTSVTVVDRPSIVEQEPNPFDHPQQVELPVTLSGAIQTPGDIDAFEFAAKKGEKLVARVMSRSLGFPLDAVVQVKTTGGKLLTRADDAGDSRDPLAKFTIPADGSYCLLVEDLTGAGGERFAYRLDLRDEADFELSLDEKNSALVLAPGKTLELPVTIARSDEFAELITIVAVDLPAGVKCEPVESPASAATAGKKGSAKTASVTLKLTAAPEAKSGIIQIRGRSWWGQTRFAEAPLGIEKQTTSRIWLEIAK